MFPLFGKQPGAQIYQQLNKNFRSREISPMFAPHYVSRGAYLQVEKHPVRDKLKRTTIINQGISPTPQAYRKRPRPRTQGMMMMRADDPANLETSVSINRSSRRSRILSIPRCLCPPTLVFQLHST